jgi:predicted ABC-type ATPase
MLKASGSRGRPAGVTIDADAIKAQLPEYQAMTRAGNAGAAAYAHEESSVIAKKIQAAAIKGGHDFTLDGTGDSSYAKLASKVTAAKAAGYKVHGQYVTVDTPAAVERATARAAKTGRMVPPSVIKEIHAGVSGAFRQAVANNLFDTSELWDNNGSSSNAIKLIGSQRAGGQFTVADQGAYARFLAKENE